MLWLIGIFAELFHFLTSVGASIGVTMNHQTHTQNKHEEDFIVLEQLLSSPLFYSS